MEFLQNDDLKIVAGISDYNAAFLEGNTLTHSEDVMTISMLPADITLWHRCFSINKEIVQKQVTGITLESKKLQDPICQPCLVGMMHANPFPMMNNHMSVPLKLVHLDVHDVNHHTFTGYRYWVTFINDYLHVPNQ